MAEPNILYLHSHDTGRYVSPYGYAVSTPYLEQFARQGVLFRQAFCANPTCSPSRASLLTGLWPHSNGMLGLAHRGFRLNDAQRYLAGVLKSAGYHTALCGVQHEAGRPEELGYERVLQTASTYAVHVAPTAAAFLNGTEPEPFFLSVGFFETHRPFPSPTAADDPRYLRPPAPLPDMPETRRDMAGFCSSVRILDDGIGRVLAALDAAGLAERTIVLITSDHGPAFPAMKCNLTDHGLGVMLMLRGPGGWEGGRVMDAMVSHLDVAPTLFETAGLEKPAWLQGFSLLPLLRGEVTEPHDVIFAETNFHAAYEPQRCVRTGRYKYIRRYAGRERPVLPNCDAGKSKTVWLEHGWSQRHVAREELFDLVFDPNECHNLIGQPDYATVAEEMRRRLHAWQLQTQDPLLNGRLIVPAGAVLDPVDGIDPDTGGAIRYEHAHPM